jgi:hypothetical protein
MSQPTQALTAAVVSPSRGKSASLNGDPSFLDYMGA